MAIAVVVFALLAISIYAYRTYQSTRVNAPIRTDLVWPTPTPGKPQPVAIALLGYGGPTHDGGYLTDTILVARVDPDKQTVFLISVPRDLWVKYTIGDNYTFDAKINAAYAIGLDDTRYSGKYPEFTGPGGGGALAKTMLSELLGFEVQYFAAVGFDGFLDGLAQLGPITVEVPESFTDEYYPIEGMATDPCGKSEEEIQALMAEYREFELEKQFTCRYETISFSKGPTQMDASTMLKFVRSRHSETAGNDFSRNLRQQAVITAIKSKLLSVGNLDATLKLTSSLARYITTDLELIAMLTQYSYLLSAPDYQVKSIVLSDQTILKHGISDTKAYILLPKDGRFESISKYVETEMNASDSAKPDGSQIQTTL